MSKKEKVNSLITYLYETMNGELALDYANLDSEKIEILLDYIEKLEKELEYYKNHQKIEVVNLGSDKE